MAGFLNVTFDILGVVQADGRGVPPAGYLNSADSSGFGPDRGAIG